MKENWIKIHRKLIESELWYKPDSWIKIWLYIVMKVNYKEDHSFLEVGEGLFKYSEIAEACGTTYNQVRGATQFLQKRQSCHTRKTTRGVFIKLLNYTKYQIKNPETTHETTNRPQTDHTLYNKNKEYKEKKINKKKESPIAERKDRHGRCFYCKSKEHQFWCQLYQSKQ